MSTATATPAPTSTPTRVALADIHVGENTRALDEQHVQALASSIALRGLIVPLLVRREQERLVLVAGFHRHAACRKLGLAEVEVSVREHEGSSADSAAENVVRKQLNPLEEARAVQAMLEEGYTLDGAATALGWSRSLVAARAKILELPEAAQQLIGSGQLPLSATALVAKIAAVSAELCEATLALIASGQASGEQLLSSPGWVIGHALRESESKAFAAHLNSIDARQIAELRLGKKTDAAYAQAEKLHRQIDRHAYGPPTIRFTEQEIDQARAAGVLIELEHSAAIIIDRSLLRELTKQAIARTLEELAGAKQREDTERAERRSQGKAEPTPQQAQEAEHRAAVRALTARAHSSNLDLGAALLKQLAAVDPNDIDVARFFVYALLGPDERGYLGGGDRLAHSIAANGIRLVLAEHRTTVTPQLKSGKPGTTKVTYAETEQAAAWLWRFIEGARSASELYGRALVVFAAEHYASQLALPASQRRGSLLPRSRKETARKAFERVVKPLLPASHTELERAIAREARAHARATEQLRQAGAATAGGDTDA